MRQQRKKDIYTQQFASNVKIKITTQENIVPGNYFLPPQIMDNY